MVLTAMGSGTAASALYPDYVGRRAIFVGNGAGPVSSSQTVGDPVKISVASWYIDSVLDGASTDGTTFVQAYPTGIGPRMTWNLFYYTNTGAQVANGTNLSGKQFVVSAFVGRF